MNRATVGGLAALLALPGTAWAQGAVGPVRSAVIYEGYSFDAGLVLSKISELTVPLGVDVRLGRMGTLTLSSGYARVSLTSADKTQLPDQQVSGLLDTELRFGFNLIPGKLILLATGALPTGIKTVQQEQLSILGAISSDIIGFSSSTLGSGGSVGGGFAGAVPLGRFALGLGATYKLPLSYQPIIGRSDELKPGAEFRMRGGVEGPLSRTTYVRLAAIFASRQKDQVAAQTQNGVGNRMIEYLAVNQGLGSSQLTLYGFDVYRGSPQVEATAAGAAILPKGNLLALGARFAVPLKSGGTSRITPRLEYRVSSAAPDTATATMQRLGSSVRAGMDLQFPLSRSLSTVLQGGYVSGNVVQSGTQVGLHGFRAALQLVLTP